MFLHTFKDVKFRKRITASSKDILHIHSSKPKGYLVSEDLSNETIRISYHPSGQPMENVIVDTPKKDVSADNVRSAIFSHHKNYKPEKQEAVGLLNELIGN